MKTLIMSECKKCVHGRVCGQRAAFTDVAESVVQGFNPPDIMQVKIYCDYFQAYGHMIKSSLSRNTENSPTDTRD